MIELTDAGTSIFVPIRREVTVEIEQVVSTEYLRHRDHFPEPYGDEHPDHPTAESICKDLLNLQDAQLGVLPQHLEGELTEVIP